MLYLCVSGLLSICIGILIFGRTKGCNYVFSRSDVKQAPLVEECTIGAKVTHGAAVGVGKPGPVLMTFLTSRVFRYLPENVASVT